MSHILSLPFYRPAISYFIIIREYFGTSRVVFLNNHTFFSNCKNRSDAIMR